MFACGINDCVNIVGLLGLVPRNFALDKHAICAMQRVHCFCVFEHKQRKQEEPYDAMI